MTKYISDSANTKYGTAVGVYTLTTPGTGYVAGNTLTFSGGDANATLYIDTVDGSGVPLTYHLTAGGSGYSASAVPMNLTGGGGAGAQATVDTIIAGLSTVNGFYTIESHNPAMFSTTDLALTTARTVTPTFTSTNHSCGVIFALTLAGTGQTTTDRSVICDLQEKVTPVTTSIANPCVVDYGVAAPADNTQIMFTTTGALPTGLAINTRYYVVNSSGNTSNVSTTLGGGTITTSGTQSGVHTAWLVRGSDTKTIAQLTNSVVSRDSMAWITPFTWTPYTISVAAIWRFWIAQTGGTSGTWYIRTSDATNPYYEAWTDVAGSISDNDYLVIKDPIVVDKSLTLKSPGLGTGDTTRSMCGSACKNSTGAVASVANMVWKNPPDASYTLTLNGLFIFGGHSGFRAGTSTNLIPASKGGTIATVAATYGTAANSGMSDPENGNSGGFIYSGKESFFVYAETPTYMYDTLNGNAASGQKNLVTTHSTGWSPTDNIVIGKDNQKTNYGDKTVYTINTISTTNIATTVNLVQTKVNGGPALNVTQSKYGFKILPHTYPVYFYFRSASNFIVSGCYTSGLEFYWGGGSSSVNYSRHFDDDANCSAFLVEKLMCYRDSAGGASSHVITNGTGPDKGLTIQNCYAIGQGLYNNGGGQVLPETATIIQNCICFGGYAPIYMAIFQKWTIQNCEFYNSYLYALYLFGFNFTLKNNKFWGMGTQNSGTMPGMVTMMTCLNATDWSGNYFDNNLYAYCFGQLAAPAVCINILNTNDVFGSESANTYDISNWSGGSYLDKVEFNSPTGNLTVDTTNLSTLAVGSRFVITDFNDTANDDRGYTPYGLYQRTGFGLADTTVWNGTAFAAAAAGQFGFRFSPTNSTTSWTYQDNNYGKTTIGNCQNLTVSVMARIKINSATYYAGTHTKPTLTVTYDGTTTTTAVATGSTSAQQLQVTFTPTTTSPFIKIELSGATDATGTNAYVYFGELVVTKAGGVMIDTTTMSGWANGYPLGTTRTFQSPASVWDELETNHAVANSEGAAMTRIRRTGDDNQALIISK